MKEKTYNILFCGIGGQGILTASEICCWAAVYEGYKTKKSEIHGMSQRGGSVESHMRFGNEVFSPIIPEGNADFLISFHKNEHNRMKHYLKKDGIDLIKYLEKAEKEIDNKKLINTYIIGVLSKYLPISENNWIKSIKKNITKIIEENIRLFLYGREEK